VSTRIFLASSAELKQDRVAFELLVNRKNKAWREQGVFLELVSWEDFLDVVSQTRLQDEYNKAIRECDVFVMLFFTKVGRYTAEEFETAFGQFKASGRPAILTYFKDAAVNTGTASLEDLTSLLAFRQKLLDLGHFVSTYQNVEGLQLHFLQQLDKLVAAGVIKMTQKDGASDDAQGPAIGVRLAGDGTAAVGPGATAAGRGSVIVQGPNHGDINLGTQSTVHTQGGAYIGGGVDTGGGDFVGRDRIHPGLSPQELEPLFAALLAAVAVKAPAGQEAKAVEQVQQLKAEVAKGGGADDGIVAKLLHGLAEMVPGAVSAVVSTFATPILGGLSGPVTKIVLERLRLS
jgi:hypothetical protein